MGIIPFAATHPGEILAEELKERGISQKLFAQALHIRPSHLNEILKGKRNISPEFAFKLEKELNIPAEIWSNMQSSYEVNLIRIYERDVKVEKHRNLLNEYNRLFDLSTFIKRIAHHLKVSDTEEVYSFLHNIVGMPNPAELKVSYDGFFRRSPRTGNDLRMRLTWILIAKYELSKIQTVGQYNKKKSEDLKYGLVKILHENKPNTIGRSIKLLSDFGIKLAIVEKTDRASIDGYSYLDKDGTPCIALTLRYNRIDTFAFTLMHEICHVLNHLSEQRRDVGLSDLDAQGEYEDEANKFASESLIPSDIWKEIPKAKLYPLQIERTLKKWAAENNLNCWIVLGRFSHETKMYNFKKDNSRDIR